MAGLTAGELGRKAVHMAVGGFAFAVRPLGAPLAALAALAAILFNAFLLPRIGGRSLWREGETQSGFALGIVLYPIAVLLLIVTFARHLEVAAATWGILAFGDGMASIVGMALGRHKLPWNPAKSWAGSLAFCPLRGPRGGDPPLVERPGSLRRRLRDRDRLRRGAFCSGARVPAPGTRRQPRGAPGHRGRALLPHAHPGAVGRSSPRPSFAGDSSSVWR
jgi:hypothetical protein